MIKIAIVDDETDQNQKINQIVTSFFKQKKIDISVDSFYDGEALLNETILYDIVFLDIQLDGIDGIETAHKIREKNKQVTLIYISNYSEKIAQSFSVHPFSFMEKPIDAEKIFKNLQDYIMYAQASNKRSFVSFIAKQHGKITVATDQIIYFEYKGNRTIQMRLIDSEHDIIGNISDLIKKLEKFDFISPHKSFIVNEVHILSFDNDIFLIGNHSIPIAKNKRKIIHEKINSYLHNHLMD